MAKVGIPMGLGKLIPEEITRLWDDHSAGLVLYARQWCAMPEDIVQEAFLLLVRLTETPAHPTAWLYTVVRHRAINAARDHGRQIHHERSRAAEEEPWFESNAEERFDALELTEALKKLPCDEREAIIMRLWGGLSFEEMGKTCGCPMSNVYRAYQRGIVALQKHFEGESCPVKKIKMKN